MIPLVRSGLVFLGAGVGANMRYWLGLWIQEKTGAFFPWGTFTINATGSLLIGMAMGWLIHAPSPLNWRLLLVVGLLGGYTTFSSFSYETIVMLKDGYYAQAAGYVLGSCALGILACWLGLILVASLSK